MKMRNWLVGVTNAVFRPNGREAKHADSARVEQNLQSKYALVESLSPQLISTTLLSLLRGDPRNFAVLWRDIKVRDDLIPSLEEKRIKSIARQEWEIITLGEETPTAKRQREALSYFFEHLHYTDCTNRDMQSGFSGLIKGIMQSIGYGWSVQEIVWEPSPQGISATFIQLPLECFKQHLGRLEFLEAEGASRGVELKNDEWLVAAYPTPLGVASLVLYYYKRLPLKDWLIYCRRFVIPALHGKTSASKGTDEWNDLRDALANFGMDYAILTGKDVEVSPLSKSNASLPYPALIERCDRSLAILWRGGDLSTLAKDGNAVGATSQEDEADIFVDDDSCFVAELLNNKLIPAVIKNTFGDVPIEVKFQFTSSGSDYTKDMAIDDKLIGWGVPTSVDDLRVRYNRPAPAEGAALVTPPRPQVQLPFGQGQMQTINSAAIFTQEQRDILRDEIFKALEQDLEPVREEIAKILTLPDDQMLEGLKQLAKDIPVFFQLIQENLAFQNAIEVKLATSWGEAFRQGQSQRTEISA